MTDNSKLILGGIAVASIAGIGYMLSNSRKKLGSVNRANVLGAYRRNPPKLTIPDEMLQAYAEGRMTQKEISQALGMNQDTVATLFRRAGVVRKRTGATKEKLEELINQNLSLAEMSKILGTSPNSVAKQLSEFGLKTKTMRRQSEAPELLEARLRVHVNQGLTVSQIAHAEGLSPSTIEKMLRDRGLKTQNMTTARRAADIPDEVLRKHVNEGLPVRSIALLLQVPYSELYYVMRDKNIKTRLKEQKQVREGLSLDDIREYVSQGLSNKEIAKRLQMDETALGSLMSKHGIASARATRIAGFQALSREELQGYANRGLSYEQIAEESGTTLHLIRKMMAEHGIKTQEIARRESLKTITPEMIQACLNEGMTKQQVAEHFKVSPTRIKAVTRKPRRTARTPISYEQLKAYVDQGMTLQQIADELDVSIVTAARRLKESNLTTKISVPKSRLEEMISQGLTKKEMAEALSISITTLYTLLRKAGLD